MSSNNNPSFVYIKNVESGKRFKFVSKGDIKKLSGAKVNAFMKSGAKINPPYRVSFKDRVLQEKDILGEIGVEVGDTLFVEVGTFTDADPLPYLRASNLTSSVVVSTTTSAMHTPRPNNNEETGNNTNTSATTPPVATVTASSPSRAEKTNNDNDADKNRPSAAPEVTTNNKNDATSTTSKQLPRPDSSSASASFVYIRDLDSGKRYKFVSKNDIKKLTGAKVEHFLQSGAKISPPYRIFFKFKGVKITLRPSDVLGHIGVGEGDTLLLSVGEESPGESTPSLQNLSFGGTRLGGLHSPLTNTSFGGRRSPSEPRLSPQSESLQNNKTSGSNNSNAITPPNTMMTKLTSPAAVEQQNQQQHQYFINIKNQETNKRYKFVAKTDITQFNGARVEKFLKTGAKLEPPFRVIFNKQVVQTTDKLVDIGVEIGSTLYVEVGDYRGDYSSRPRSREVLSDTASSIAVSLNSSLATTPREEASTTVVASPSGDNQQQQQASSALSSFVYIKNKETNKKYKFVSKNNNVTKLSGARVDKFLQSGAAIQPPYRVLVNKTHVLQPKDVLGRLGVKEGDVLYVEVGNYRGDYSSRPRSREVLSESASSIAVSASSSVASTPRDSLRENSSSLVVASPPPSAGENQKRPALTNANAATSFVYIKNQETNKKYKFVSKNDVTKLTGARVDKFLQSGAGIQPPYRVLVNKTHVLQPKDVLGRLGVKEGDILYVEVGNYRGDYSSRPMSREVTGESGTGGLSDTASSIAVSISSSLASTPRGDLREENSSSIVIASPPPSAGVENQKRPALGTTASATATATSFVYIKNQETNKKYKFVSKNDVTKLTGARVDKFLQSGAGIQPPYRVLVNKTHVLQTREVLGNLGVKEGDVLYLEVGNYRGDYTSRPRSREVLSESASSIAISTSSSVATTPRQEPSATVVASPSSEQQQPASSSTASATHPSFVYIKNQETNKRYKFVSKNDVTKLTGSRVDKFLQSGANVQPPYRVIVNKTQVLQSNDVLGNVGVREGDYLYLEVGDYRGDYSSRPRSREVLSDTASSIAVSLNSSLAVTPREDKSATVMASPPPPQDYERQSAVDSSSSSPSFLFIKNQESGKKYKFVSKKDVTRLDGARVDKFLQTGAKIERSFRVLVNKTYILQANDVLGNLGVKEGDMLHVEVGNYRGDYSRPVSREVRAGDLSDTASSIAVSSNASSPMNTPREANNSNVVTASPPPSADQNNNNAAATAAAAERLAQEVAKTQNNNNDDLYTSTSSSVRMSSTIVEPNYSSTTSHQSPSAASSQFSNESFIYIKNQQTGKRYKFVSKNDIKTLTGAKVDNFLQKGAKINPPYRVVNSNGKVLESDNVLADLDIEVGDTLLLELGKADIKSTPIPRPPPTPPSLQQNNRSSTTPASRQQQQQQTNSQQDPSYIYIKNVRDGKRYKFVSKTDIKNLTGARIDQFLQSGAGIHPPYRVVFHKHVVHPGDVLRDLGVEIGSTLHLEIGVFNNDDDEQKHQKTERNILNRSDPTTSSKVDVVTPTSQKQQQQQQQQQQRRQSTPRGSSSGSRTPRSKPSTPSQPPTWILIRNSEDNKKYKFVSKGNIQDLTGRRVKQFMNVAADLEEDEQRLTFDKQIVDDDTVLRDIGVGVGSTLFVKKVDPREEQLRRNGDSTTSAGSSISGSSFKRHKKHHPSKNGSKDRDAEDEPFTLGGKKILADNENENKQETPSKQLSSSLSAAGAGGVSPGSLGNSLSAGSPSSTSIYIKNIESGKKYKFVSAANVSELTGGKIKHFLSVVAGFAVEDQTIRFNSMIIDDWDNLTEHGIEHKDVLVLETNKFNAKRFLYDGRDRNNTVSEAMLELLETILEQKESMFDDTRKEMDVMKINEFLEPQQDVVDPIFKYKRSIGASAALEVILNGGGLDEDENYDNFDEQQDEEEEEEEVVGIDNSLVDQQHHIKPESMMMVIENDNEEEEGADRNLHLSPRERRQVLRRLQQKDQRQIDKFALAEQNRRIEIQTQHYNFAMMRLLAEFEDDVRGSLFDEEDFIFQRHILQEDAIIMSKLHTRQRVQRKIDAKGSLDEKVEACELELKERYARELDEARDSDFAVRFRKSCNRAHDYLRDETHLMFQQEKINALKYFGLGVDECEFDRLDRLNNVVYGGRSAAAARRGQQQQQVQRPASSSSSINNNKKAASGEESFDFELDSEDADQQQGKQDNKQRPGTSSSSVAEQFADLEDFLL